MLQNVLFVIGVTVMGIIPTVWLTSRVTRREVSWIWSAYFVHVVAAWLHLWVVYSFYYGGDASYYYFMGEQLRTLIVARPEYFTEVLKLTANIDASLPFPVRGSGNATGAMSGLATLILIVGGGSVYAAGTVISVVSFYSLVLLYLTFRQYLPPNKWIAALTLYMPSSTFWGSGLTKETAAVAGMCLGLSALVFWKKEKLSGLTALPLTLSGFFVVYVFKPYILVAIIAALGVAIFNNGRISGLRLFSGLITTVLLMVGATTLMPEYAPDRVIQQVGGYQQQYPQIQAGSNFEYAQSGDTSLSGQLKNVPLALVSSFFRPFIFEVHNFAAALGALETTVFLLLFLKIVFRDSLKRIWRKVTADQLLLFSLVFTIILGVAVGLSAPNLGTLSRYRMPMIPFWGLILVSLARPSTIPQLKRVS